ncbi:Uncharacterised protein [Serratia liquefaciens]|nr:Uncharacterised protein [Serratia liquefaciens]
MLDLKSNRITIHYAVQDQQREQRLFFQDITISAPNRIGPKTYTFRIEAVHKFDSDTTGGDVFLAASPATGNRE